MIYKIIIPARANSSRLPGKNMKLLGGKPLIEYSIDFAINHFSKDSVWVNSDGKDIIEFSKRKGVKTLLRPSKLASETSSVVDALKFHVNYFKKYKIACDAIILFQPTNPFRESNLFKEAIEKFEKSKRNSLATFSMSTKKLGKIKNKRFKPINYKPGQRSQDLEKNYFENGLIYITKCDSVVLGQVITEDVYPLVCNNIESLIDIDYFEDFKLAEALLNFKNE